MGRHTTVRLRIKACPSAGWGASSGHRGPPNKRRLHHLHARGRWHLGRRVNAARSRTRTHARARAPDHSSPLRTLPASPRRARSSLTTCFGRGSFTTCPGRPRSAHSQLPRAPPRSQQLNDLLRSRQLHDLHRLSHGRFSHGPSKNAHFAPPPKAGPRNRPSTRALLLAKARSLPAHHFHWCSSCNHDNMHFLPD